MTGPFASDGTGTWFAPKPLPPCRACGYVGDAFTPPAAGTDGPEPEEGSFIVCFRCGEVDVLVIHPLLGVTVRPPTTEELEEFSADPANGEAVRKLHLFHAVHGGDATGT